jgi:hypothetical protein
VQPGPQVAGFDHDPGAGRDAADDVARQRRRAVVHGPAQLAGKRARRLGPRVEADPRPVAGGRQAARGPHPVQATADDADRPRALAGQRLRGDRRDRAGAQRRDRARVEEHERLRGDGV